MVKISPGDDYKRRAKWTLEALLAYANGQFSIECNFEAKWEVNESKNQYKLIVENCKTQQLFDLVKQYCQAKKIQDKKKGNWYSDKNVRDTIFKNFGDDFLKLFTDKSTANKHRGERHFVFDLWCQDTQKNIEELDRHWDIKKGKTNVNTEEDKIHTAQELDDLLLTLNYTLQEANFNNSQEQAKRTAAYLITAPSFLLQKWLTKRLAIAIPGFANAFPITPINIYEHDIRIDFQYFLDDLANQLSLKKSNITEEDIIQSICKRCESSSLILVLYKINILMEDESILRQLMKFWEKVVQQANSRKKWSFRSQVILLMTEDPTNYQYPFLVQDQLDPKNTAIPVRLGESAQITPQEVISWLRRNDVYERLSKRLGEQTVTNYAQMLESLVSTISIDDICRNCGLENGVAEIEQYWNLTA